MTDRYIITIDDYILKFRAEYQGSVSKIVSVTGMSYEDAEVYLMRLAAPALGGMSNTFEQLTTSVVLLSQCNYNVANMTWDEMYRALENVNKNPTPWK